MSQKRGEGEIEEEERVSKREWREEEGSEGKKGVGESDRERGGLGRDDGQGKKVVREKGESVTERGEDERGESK